MSAATRTMSLLLQLLLKGHYYEEEENEDEEKEEVEVDWVAAGGVSRAHII